MIRWRRIGFAAGIASVIPAAAEAHALSGSGGWADELICLVPALVLLGLVLFLGRDDKGKSGGKGK